MPTESPRPTTAWREAGLHEVRYGALDRMGEFRGILTDLAVLSLLNNRRLTLEDFDFV